MTRRVQRRRRRPPQRATAECLAVAHEAADGARASSARERAATNGEQQRLDGGRPSSRRGYGCVTAQRSTAQETRRVQRRRRWPPRRAAAEGRAIANAATDRAVASSERERRCDERQAAATYSAQEAQATAPSGGRVPSRRERGGRPSGRGQRTSASPRRAARSSDAMAGGRRAVAATSVGPRRGLRRKGRAAFSAGGAGRRVERRLSVEPSRTRRPPEQTRAARASVAATSGEQQQLEGRRPSRHRGHGRVTAQRSTAQNTRRVQRRRRRPPRRAAAECRAVANAAADRAGASSARERRRDER